MQEEKADIKLGDGSSTKITIFRMTENEPGPVVIIFPAMGTPASYYQPFAEALAKENIIVVTADLRGIGASSVRPGMDGDFGFMQMIEYDIKSVVAEVNSAYPNSKKYILGHSLGGQLGGLFMSKYPNQVEGLILVASCSVYYKGWPGLGKLKTLIGTQVFGGIASVMGYFPGHKLGFGGKGAKGVMQDWSRTARTGKYIVNNDNFDYEANLSKLSIPILAISFKGDELSPKAAVKNLLHKFNPSSAITHHHLYRSSMDNKMFNHFNWIRNNQDVVRIVKNWFLESTQYS